MQIKSNIQTILTILWLLVLSGCGGASGDNTVTTTPTIGAKLTITVTNGQNQSISTAEATSAVYINVKATNDFGRAVSGVSISFSTDLGSLSQSSDVTGSDGIASVRLVTTESQLGAASITADGAVDGQALSTSAVLNITELVTITPSLNLTLLDTSCTTPVTTVAAGTSVCVKASLFSDTTAMSNEIITLNSTQGDIAPTQTLTDANGVATATITSTATVLGATTVTASHSSSGVSSTKNFEYSPPVTGQIEFAVKVLDANCANEVVTVIAGTSLCMRATLLSNSNPVVGHEVTFAATKGILQPNSKLTDPNGHADVLLTSSIDLLGAASVTANTTLSSTTHTATDSYEFSEFIPAPNQDPQLSLVTLDANCAGQVSSQLTGDTFCLKATLSQNGLPLVNQIINFSAPVGVLAQTTALTNSAGVALTLLSSNDFTNGAAVATASFGNFTAQQNYQFTPPAGNTNPTLSLVMLDSGCINVVNSLPAGGSYCLQASLFLNNQPQVGEIINFNAGLGTLRTNATLTNGAGIATVLLDSTTSIIGAAIASATFASVTSTQNYQFLESTSDVTVNLALAVLNAECANETSSAAAGSSLCLQATLKQGSVPLANEVINFAAPIGVATPSSALTNAAGVARVSVTSTAADVGAATATATFAQSTAGANYEFTLSGPLEQTTLNLEIYDQNCSQPVNTVTAGTDLCMKAYLLQGTQPITGEIVSFNATLGTLSPSSALTDNNGLAKVILRSNNTNVGAATVTASYQAFSATQNYQLLVSDNNLNLSLTTYKEDCVTANSSFAAGSVVCLEAVLLNDTTPVANEIVNFEFLLGTLRQASALTDEQGKASVLADSNTAILGASTATVAHNNLLATANYEFVSDTSLPNKGPKLVISTLQNGVFKNRFKAGEAVQLQALFLDGDDLPIANSIVSFTVERGVLNASSSLTDVNGLAQVSLIGSINDLGAARANAQVTVSGVTYTDSFNYEILAVDAVELDSVQIGYFDSSDQFITNQLGVGGTVNPDGSVSLSAGGTIGVSLAIVDDSNQRITTPISVTFSSTCVTNGQATLDTKVVTINGVANATYTDTNCATAIGSQDTVRASITVNNTVLSASRVIRLTPETIGTIEFVSAVPENIVLPSAGGTNPSSSVLTFRVKGNLGNPLAQKIVDFTLDGTAGGLTLSRPQSTTNSQGLVTTTVNAGTAPAVVRVTASTTGIDENEQQVELKTQSNLLTVNTGLADQNSITFSSAILNPETGSINGTEVLLTAFMADSFNNPVPDGTVVNFTTEGGLVEASCATLKGLCTVNWTSAEPRPADHRITLLAYAIGHETFFDVNGDNVFGDEDGGAISQNIDSGFGRGSYQPSGFVDMAEAWRDDNENRIHDSGELVADHNNNGIYDVADGKFNGPVCSHSSLCADSSANKTYIRKAFVMVMSSSNAQIALMTDSLTGANTSPAHIGGRHVILTNDPALTTDGSVQVTSTGTVEVVAGEDIILDESQSLKMQFTFSDDASPLGQVLPFGTKVAVSTSVGTLTGTTAFEVGNTIGYFSGDGVLQYGGDEIEFILSSPNDATTTGDIQEIGFLTVTFTFLSGTTLSLTKDLIMLGDAVVAP